MTVFYTLMTRGSLERDNKYHLNKENLQWSTTLCACKKAHS